MLSTERQSLPQGNQKVAEQFKLVLRGVAATTTIITTGEGNDWWGMVATAVMPISMDPPSLTVTINRSASSREVVARTGRFCLNVLPVELAGFSRDFLMRPEDSRLVWSCSSRMDTDFAGVPHLRIAQSFILCSAFRLADVGTHLLFFADVRSVAVMGPNRPLDCVDGIYGRVERSERLVA